MKLKLPPTPESRSIVVEAPTQRKTSAAQRKAIQRYESNFKRINCRLPLDLWHKIESTGISANSVIISALEKYLSE